MKEVTMDITTGLVMISSIHLLAAASPGPDFVLVSQQTLSQGKKAGLLCSLGIALGLSVHIAYSALGLAAVIANSASLLTLIKLVGASYLLYLGYQGIRSTARKEQAISVTQSISPSPAKTIGLGFLCNALNPKAPVYFVALFTLVISPDTPLNHLFIYGLWMMFIQFAWFATVVLLLSRPTVNKKFQQMGHWLDRIMGLAMIALGIKMLTTKL
ncbi:LysE family transporter [Thalassotalea sp. G2M2-11]|uniref:LysE family translocator n=1 Tax=Thalassotalea sp. G2M2-11 TaxID=2787627 RepID=UPI0019D31D56|nr:LysE family transporter [Thalassotalea sp. G2M2-11]